MAKMWTLSSAWPAWPSNIAIIRQDVMIDLIGYRRHGHSEVDDPTITQPLLYKKIKEHPPLWEIYAEDIGATDVQKLAPSKPSSEPRRKMPGKFARSQPCAICPNTGTDTLVAGTGRSTKWKPESPLTNSPNYDSSHDVSEGFHIHPESKEAAGATRRNG